MAKFFLFSKSKKVLGPGGKKSAFRTDCKYLYGVHFRNEFFYDLDEKNTNFSEI